MKTKRGIAVVQHMFPQEEVHRVFHMGHFFPVENVEKRNGDFYVSTCAVCGVEKSIIVVPTKVHGSLVFVEWRLNNHIINPPLTCEEIIIREIIE